MSSGIGQVLANVTTGGLYGAATNLAAGRPGAALGSLSPVGFGAKGTVSGTLMGNNGTKSSAPTSGPGPTAPTLDDASKQAALDEQKRAAGSGPSTLTNIGGASGILTDPNAKYVKGQLLGGA